jgi:hypothetical protein
MEGPSSTMSNTITFEEAEKLKQELTKFLENK